MIIDRQAKLNLVELALSVVHKASKGTGILYIHIWFQRELCVMKVFIHSAKRSGLDQSCHSCSLTHLPETTNSTSTRPKRRALDAPRQLLIIHSQPPHSMTQSFDLLGRTSVQEGGAPCYCSLPCHTASHLHSSSMMLDPSGMLTWPTPCFGRRNHCCRSMQFQVHKSTYSSSTVEYSTSITGPSLCLPCDVPRPGRGVPCCRACTHRSES